MQVFVWTLSFLVLLTILAYARLEHFVEAQGISVLTLGNQAAERDAQLQSETNYYKRLAASKETGKSQSPPDETVGVAEQQEIEKEKADAAKPKKASQKLNRESKEVKRPLYLDFPPHNSRLNLFALFKETGDSKPYYELTCRLIKNLYGHLDFFKKVPDAERRIVDGILLSTLNEKEKDAKILLKKTEDLLLVPFNDAELREIYYRMLKGGELPHTTTTKAAYPSILEFVYFDAARRKFEVNIHHAPFELLVAVFNNAKVAEELDNSRMSLHTHGKRVNRNGLVVTDTHLNEEMVSKTLEAYHLKFADFESLLDFSTRKPNEKDMAQGFYLKGHSENGQLEMKKKIDLISIKN